jgi:hypothetical protein
VRTRSSGHRVRYRRTAALTPRLSPKLRAAALAERRYFAEPNTVHGFRCALLRCAYAELLERELASPEAAKARGRA